MTDQTTTTEQDIAQEQKTEAEIDSHLTTLKDEIATLKDAFLREKAENENIRKRMTKELEEAHKYGVTNFARDLLEVLENLNRALETEGIKELQEPLKSMFKGVEMTKENLEKVFEKYGIERIYPLNKPFDHNYHQAIVHTESDDHEVGIVMQVIQSGYTIKDRLLRPALVAVSKGSAPK